MSIVAPVSEGFGTIVTVNAPNQSMRLKLTHPPWLPLATGSVTVSAPLDASTKYDVLSDAVTLPTIVADVITKFKAKLTVPRIQARGQVDTTFADLTLLNGTRVSGRGNFTAESLEQLNVPLTSDRAIGCQDKGKYLRMNTRRWRTRKQV